MVSFGAAIESFCTQPSERGPLKEPAMSPRLHLSPLLQHTMDDAIGQLKRHLDPSIEGGGVGECYYGRRRRRRRRRSSLIITENDLKRHDTTREREIKAGYCQRKRSTSVPQGISEHASSRVYIS